MFQISTQRYTTLTDTDVTFQNRLTKIRTDLRHALVKDRRRIQSQLDRLIKNRHTRDAADVQTELSQLAHQARTSTRTKQRRIEQIPDPAFDDNLPICAQTTTIIDAIQTHQVVIVAGETGSGKTTQLPKMCLAAGRGIEGVIGCTQPRRIAAVTVAKRIAEELNTPPGQLVGYKIRFTDNTQAATRIKIMTDGILLAETQTDRWLNQYDTLIVDEAHERSLNIDFVLGILKTLLKKRRDLKLIITSATIDTAKFSRAFDNAPVIEVSGRMFPVDVRYMPAEAFRQGRARQRDEDLTHIEMAVAAVEKLAGEPGRGDMLVFMPTEQDIRDTCELLIGRNLPHAVILPLFGRLAAAEQGRVFETMTGRKVIVATNVAETSLTIPGIKYVIDTGLARISRYLPRTRTTALPVVPISQSSADQRKGRSGRVAHGVCVRLYDEEDFEKRPLYSTPEILRSNLAEVILRMMALRLGDVAQFPFIDPPDSQSIRDGFKLLEELSALKRHKQRHQLTPMGRRMARMPLDPRLSRILIEAAEQNCLADVTAIAAVLSIQDPRERPVEKEQQAEQARREFVDPQSDFITLLNIWQRFNERCRKEKGRGLRAALVKKFCRQYFLSFRRMREWQDIHGQLQTTLADLPTPKHPPKPAKTKKDTLFGARYTAIHKALLAGFLANIARQKEGNLYTAARGRTAMLFPGSGLFGKGGPWIVAAQMVQTTRLFARTAAQIDPQWLEPLAKPHCTYAYLNPHWQRRQGAVLVTEQVSLFGLIIATRLVQHNRIAPDEACDIFVRSALVEEDVRRPLPFMTHNRRVIDDIEDMENRLRRRDLFVGDEQIYQFYRRRIDGLSDMRSLQAFIKRQGTDTFLRISRDDLLRRAPDEVELEQFPSKITLGGRQFDCDYRFDPKMDDDGVTVNIPATLAAAVPVKQTEWLVPGLLREKIITLIKGLPKPYRKQLVPVADTVDAILPHIAPGTDALITTLADVLYKRYAVNIPADAWPLDELPAHLKMRIAVTDPKGRELAAGRDTAVLARSGLEFDPARALKKEKAAWEKTGLTRWDFGDVPETTTLTGAKGHPWVLFPGLQPTADCTETVDLKLFSDRRTAREHHCDAVVRLFRNHFEKDIKYLHRNLMVPPNLKDAAIWFGGPQTVIRRLIDGLLRHLCRQNIRQQHKFHAQIEQIGGTLRHQAMQWLTAIQPVLRAYHECRTELSRLERRAGNQPPLADLLAARANELERLVPAHFAGLYPRDRFSHLCRYIKTIAIRAQRALDDLERHRVRTLELAPFEEALQHILKSINADTSAAKRQAAEAFHWMLEEYKVSLFAQELKTAMPVSKKRLAKKQLEIERMA